MSVGELARVVGRSIDTIKRWEDQGLLRPERDALGRRVYAAHHIDQCRELGRLAVEAQRKSTKLSALVADREHPRLPLFAGAN